MKKIFVCAALAVAAVFILTGGLGSTTCRYCGSSSYGSGCLHSPYGKHQHRGTASSCEYCGNSSYGSGCPHSPYGKHEH